MRGSICGSPLLMLEVLRQLLVFNEVVPRQLMIFKILSIFIIL
jgi:hypothetical protein